MHIRILHKNYKQNYIADFSAYSAVPRSMLFYLARNISALLNPFKTGGAMPIEKSFL